MNEWADLILEKARHFRCCRLFSFLISFLCLLDCRSPWDWESTHQKTCCWCSVLAGVCQETTPDWTENQDEDKSTGRPSNPESSSGQNFPSWGLTPSQFMTYYGQSYKKDLIIKINKPDKQLLYKLEEISEGFDALKRFILRQYPLKWLRTNWLLSKIYQTSSNWLHLIWVHRQANNWRKKEMEDAIKNLKNN